MPHAIERRVVALRRRPLRDAPALARHALRTWLATLDCPDGVGSDAVLVVSELTTNAVVHARSSAAIVGSLDDGWLRIEVHDDDPTRPQMSATPGAEGGWGLRIVDAITDGWGWAPTLTGKYVWSEQLC